LNPEEFGLLLKENIRSIVYQKYKEYGFSYVTLDLMGYRTGSMNEVMIV
ncbi:TIGR00268 family protein, partial [Clostridioides difficile]|nr:TIGR00268 family protein [Clostridioides difficile]